MATTDLTSIEDVKLQAKIVDSDDDAWLAAAIEAVSSVMESECRRWLAPRGSVTRYFDGAAVRDSGRVLPVADGFNSLTYLGVAATDQPDDGTGTYTEITTGIHLRGRFAAGWPATRIELDGTATRLFPLSGYNAIRATGAGGPTVVLPRVRELSTIAVVRAFRARSGGSEDIVVVGPGNGMRILRRIAPAEMDELIRDYAPDTRPAIASVSLR